MKPNPTIESWERPIDRRASLHVPSPRLDYRPVEERIQDFNEACLGYTIETARLEASRCIQCPDPQACVLACPLHNDIPSALWEISLGNFIEAANIYRQTSSFPELCGRLCPDEYLCAGSCGVGKHYPNVRLGRLEAFVCDFQRQAQGLPAFERPPHSAERAAVVGSGPAGLAAAESLIKHGRRVTVFDKNARPGGTLAYAIPRFRLPISVLEDKIKQLEYMGVEFVTGVCVGRDIQLGDIFAADYRAVLLSTGAGLERQVVLPGSALKGVWRANDFLMRTNLDPGYLAGVRVADMDIGEQVIIFGRGHAAIDSARSAVRLGASQVICLHSGTEMDMLCRLEDRLAAEEEGVIFQHLSQPLRLEGDENDRLRNVVCQQMRPKCTENGRSSVPIDGAFYILPADTFIFAQERGPNVQAIKAVPGLETTPSGWITRDPQSGQTNLNGVFAAGDNAGEEHLAAFAIAEGQRVAKAMHEFIG
jgi:glutamate synthase (NADPH/NADH) small chain